MRPCFDVDTPRKAVNLTVNADLLKSAKRAGINLSATLEQALAQKLKERWLADNKETFEAYNKRLERDGVFSDGLRSF